MSKELTFVETAAGDHLIGAVANVQAFEEDVASDRPANLFDVFKVVTVTIPVSPQNAVRVTKLARMDFSDGPLPVLKVRVSSYYFLSPEVVEKYVKPEIDDITERANRPPMAEPSSIVQARAVPRFVPGPSR